MSDKSDYFFVNVKQIFPNFAKPSQLEGEIWEEVLQPYSFKDILEALKAYRKCEDVNFAPNPAKLKKYLYRHDTVQDKPVLPLSPEAYLMEQDIKAGRCKYFFPTYCKAVEYVLNDKLLQLLGEVEFKKLSRARRYRLAVDNGLFADFDKILDLVYSAGAKNNG